MPPKGGKDASAMKQTTLKGFFAKPSTSAGASQSTPAPKKTLPATQTPKPKPKLDVSEASSQPSSATKTPSSQSVKSSSSTQAHESSPANRASSPIDVDEEDDGVEVVLSTQPSKRKRKLVMDGSDAEDEDDVVQTKNAFAAKLVGLAHTPRNARGPVAKKPRPSVLLSDDEDEGAASRSENDNTSFRAPSSTRGSSVVRDLTTDDDDDGTASEAASVSIRAGPKNGKGKVSTSKTSKLQALAAAKRQKNGRASGASSGVSSADEYENGSDDDDDGDDEPAFEASDEDMEPQPKKGKKAAAGKSKAASSKGVSAASSTVRPSVHAAGSSNSFLTAAELKAQSKKEEKRANETTYSFLQIRKDKDGNLPDSPDFDPRTLYIPKSAWTTFTPFEKQFWEIKQDHYDTVLFFQKGKFFELYENDAEIGHVEFDLKLTDRVKMKMVGVPESSFDYWAAKFLAKGHKVGKVEQAETQLGAEMRAAAAKKSGKSAGGDKIVRRELAKILTNGTLVDAQMLQDEQAGHLVAIRESPDIENAFGLCILDAATGEFNISTFEDDVCGTRLETVIRQLRPKEMLFTKGNLSVATTRLLKSILSDACIWSPMGKNEGLDYDATLEALKDFFPPPDDEMDADDETGLPSSVPEAIRSIIDTRVAVESLGSMIWYLRTLNLDKDMLSMKNFCIYDPMRQGRGLVLDGQTLAHIEVLRNSEGTDEGTLLKLLGNCITPFGKRLFRLWLCMPLREVQAINQRLDAVDDLMDNPTFEDDFTSLAKGLPDLERIVARIHAGSCKPKDFLKVLAAFRTLSEGLASLAETASRFKSRSISGLLRGAPDLEPYVQNIESLFKGPDEDDDVLVPEPGKHDAFDEVEAEIKQFDKSLNAELKTLQQRHGEDMVFWHSSLGNKDVYLVETSAKFKPPSSWVKKSGTKTKIKWEVPSMLPVIRQWKEAQETKKAIVKDFKLRVFADFDVDRSTWLSAVKVMAELDCLFSLAKSSSSLGQPCCRPTFVEGDEAFVEFTELRHPSIALRDTFIPNDVKLGSKSERVVLLTGPNMGGKSTAMRMTASGVIMAQLGMYVPAKKARISPVDSILTRMGAYDNMFSNASTFKVEMDECCKILREATPKSLVILDELGRGTSTYDGMAIAGAVLHQLASHTLALCCFATHYSSLTEDYAYHPNIRNMHMGTLMDEEERKLVFTYKLTDGAASGSFGTHVASLAGVSQSVVDRAEQISLDFAQQFRARLEAKRSASSRLPLMTQADFAFLSRTAAEGSSGDVQKLNRVLDVLSASVQSSLSVSSA